MSYPQARIRLTIILIFTITLITILSSRPISAVSTSGSVKLNTTIGESISMSITGNADNDPICDHSQFTSCSTFGSILPNSYASTYSRINVFTNSTSGYSLSVKAKEHAALQASDDDEIGSIPAGILSGEIGGQGIWSYKTDDTGVKPNWTAITIGDTVIKGTSVYEAEENETTVTYGLSTNDSQSTGRYSTTLVYTATAPNSTDITEPITPLTVHLNEGIYGVYIKADRLDGGAVSLVTEDGATVEIALGRSYYLIPLYESGYTLASITPDGGTTTVGTNGYHYYKTTNKTINEVTLTGKTLTSALTDSSLPVMQTLSSASCPAIPTAVRDSRDNSVYYIQKLADGNCWMLENLRLVGGTTLTPADSNVETEYIIPTGEWSYTYQSGRVASDYNTISTTGYGPGRNLIGSHYNHCAVTAGTICTYNNSIDSRFSICPAGWILPSSKYFPTLATAIGQSSTSSRLSGAIATTYRYHLSTPLSGWRNSTVFDELGTGGVFWSSTHSTAGSGGFFVSHLRIQSDIVSLTGADSINRAHGISARCVLDK